MNQTVAHIHAIGTAVPEHDVHHAFIGWAIERLEDERERALFRRMATRSGIGRRWSVLRPGDAGAIGAFYGGERFPSTADRMAIYARAAPDLSMQAIRNLQQQIDIKDITHIVVASCTGFVAPGIDQIIAERLGLAASVERTLVGFMGCYAAVAALRVAHHIVRSEPKARVLVVAVELSTLHLQLSTKVEPLLAMLQFADGAAAALVSAEPSGIAIDRFFAATLPDSTELIRWTIGDQGFAMHLSGEVPVRIAYMLGDAAANAALFPDAADVDAWAVHAGGRSILDAVEHGLSLSPDALSASRSVLERYGNMSSATLMFVLAKLMQRAQIVSGAALAFGPGLAAEGFRFRRA